MGEEVVVGFKGKKRGGLVTDRVWSVMKAGRISGGTSDYLCCFVELR